MVLGKLTDHVTEAEIDNEIIVMRIDTGDFYSLTGTAATIWRLIDGNRDRIAVIEALSAKFPDIDARLFSEADEFIDELEELGLIANT